MTAGDGRKQMPLVSTTFFGLHLHGTGHACVFEFQLFADEAGSYSMSTIEHHDLLAGLVRLHILYHAAKHEIYGQWMIDELARHGYKLSPGTLYPMLHGLEKKGYLSCRRLREGRTVRNLYSATEFGKAGLALAKTRLRELTGEAMKVKTNVKKRMEQKAGDCRRSQRSAAGPMAMR